MRKKHPLFKGEVRTIAQQNGTWIMPPNIYELVRARFDDTGTPVTQIIHALPLHQRNQCVYETRGTQDVRG